MQRGLLLLCLWGPMVALAADTLTVAPGETWTVTPDRATLALKALRVGDGARIEFAEGVRHWRVRADRAVIGERVVIDGRGHPGEDGRAGATADGEAALCEDGQHGQPGTAATAGGAGVSVSLRLGLVSLGGLTVDARGGNGGDGGAGGDGQDGGPVNQCHGPKGGHGGDGGVGGNGGDAGDVTITYWNPLSDAVTLDSVAERIAVRVAGGAAGDGGAGGEGGEGSGGRYVKVPYGSGRKWLPGGRNGHPGQDGAAGQSGRDGRVRVDEDLQAKLELMLEQGAGEALRSAATDPVPDDATRRELRALRETVRDLTRRVEALEGQ